MRTARMLAPVALTLASAGLTAAPALAAEGPALRIHPATAEPGATVTVETGACAADGAAYLDPSAVGAETAALAPDGDGPEVGGRFRVPASAQPGTYEIRVTCPSGGEARGELVVTMAGAGGPAHPRGHVESGVGGALGTDPVRTTGGIAALAVAAAGGTWLLHRRVQGDGF